MLPRRRLPSVKWRLQSLPPLLLQGGLRTALVLALVLPPTEGALAAAQEEGTADLPFTEVIDVRVVEVEAVVTGKDGERIHGLEAADFRLFVDGRPVPIDYFEEVRVAAEVPRQRPRRPGPRTRFIEATPAATRSYLVFIDDYFTHRGRRKRLLDNLVQEAQSLQPGERMAVVRYEGKALEVISDWTDSKDQLTRALEDARRRTPAELLRRARYSGSASVRFNARLSRRHIRQVTNAMATAMRSLANVEGRKLFLPVTTGWNFDPSLRTRSPFEGVSAENAGVASGGNPFLTDLPTLQDVSRYLNEELLWPVTDAANLFGYTVYPLHVGDMHNVQWTSLWTIARDTGGGFATRGAANPTPLAPIREDTRSYYVLAFTPDWEWDDQRHEVHVEVDVPHAKVRHRTDFRDLSLRTQRAQRVEEALLVDVTEGDLEVRLGESEKVKRTVVELPVEVVIPMDWVTMVPVGERWQGALELRIAALDKRGDRSEMPVIPVRLAGPEPEPGSRSIFETRVQVRDIEQRLVLSLTDRLSGEARVAAIDYSP